MNKLMNKIFVAAALSMILSTTGCFWQKGKQRELPPPHETPTADTIPSDVENVPDAVPRDEPLSQYGNPESYTVYGETYQVLPSAQGYGERGYASWYGRKFHGRRTSSGEIYDMYQMTAAHRTLPLPSFVRVMNLENNREIVVRVNDRGPFHSDRIIDLSYAAAAKLGILDAGSAMVKVEAINTGNPIAQAPQSAPAYPTAPQAAPAPNSYPDAAGDNYQTPGQIPGKTAGTNTQAYPQGPSVTGGGYDLNVPSANPVPVPVAPPVAPTAPAVSSGSIYDQPPTDLGQTEPASIYDTPASVYDTPETDYNAGAYSEPQYNAAAPAPTYEPAYSSPPTAYAPINNSAAPGTYLQAGAYGQASNAYAMAERLRNAGFNNVLVNSTTADGLSRVHVGPYDSNASMDSDKRRLQTLGIKAFTVRQ